MRWYILKYIFEGHKFFCRIQACSFKGACESAMKYVVGAARILSIAECPVQR